ncbi:MAG: DNA methyltransferase, partial [Nanoarchaeota archaeon]
MQNLLEDLTKLLSKEEKYTSEGRMLKNVVIEDALRLDPMLIKLLLSDKKIKKHFFQDIEGTYIFDKIKFQKFISNKQFLPDSYTAFKNKIGLTTSDEYITEKKDVVLNWPYKDCVLEGGQDKEDAKRDEVFWNETLAPDEIDRLLSPKVLTNWKKFDKDGEHTVDEFSEKDNLIIKGNNLLGLSSILKKYRGMVKLIYIDPPYYFDQLTATDSFKYNSNFHLSTWLVFMKDRLKLAKKLLTTGGTIWINISEDGMHYLKVLADAIFGSDHFIGTIPRRTRSGKSDVPFNFSQDFDWILVYTNVEESNSVVGREVQRDYYETEDYPGRPWRLADLTSQQPANKRPNSYFTMKDPKTGKEYPASEKRTWALTKDTFDYYYQKGAIVFPDDYDFLNITKPYARKFKDDDDSSGKLSSVISDFLIQDFLKAVLNESKNMDGNSQIDSMFGRDAFDYAKPENLIKSVLEVATSDDDLVLDFFLGAGTTCAVAHKLGRRYIGIEQMDYIERLSVERLKQVISGDQVGISNQVNWQGGGSFIFCELAKANQEYIDKINEAKD